MASVADPNSPSMRSPFVCRMMTSKRTSSAAVAGGTYDPIMSMASVTVA